MFFASRIRAPIVRHLRASLEGTHGAYVTRATPAWAPQNILLLFLLHAYRGAVRDVALISVCPAAPPGGTVHIGHVHASPSSTTTPWYAARVTMPPTEPGPGLLAHCCIRAVARGTRLEVLGATISDIPKPVRRVLLPRPRGSAVDDVADVSMLPTTPTLGPMTIILRLPNLPRVQAPMHVAHFTVLHTYVRSDTSRLCSPRNVGIAVFYACIVHGNHLSLHSSVTASGDGTRVTVLRASPPRVSKLVGHHLLRLR